MHYAEFAEDEVSSFVRLTAMFWTVTIPFQLTIATERSFAAGHQGIREQQVEGNWAKGGQAR